jgi:regulation of enolase protein 1 (concanavalin A-like superfamily)
MKADVDFTIAGLAFTTAEPDAWTFADPLLTGVAGPRTDLFVDPATGETTLNAPRLLAPAPAGDFQLSARVSVEFGSTYDAGALLLWAGDDTWTKLAFEYSPQGDGMVVTVVTRGLSDDANGYTVDGPAVWLRVARVGAAYACHASRDGARWDFVRHFSLNPVPTAVGFEVQSPLGESCRASFTDIGVRPATLADLRDGT